MKSTRSIMLVVFLLAPVFCMGQGAPAGSTLKVENHTAVMLFTIQHQQELAKWLTARPNHSKPSKSEVLQFLARLSDTRSTADVHRAFLQTISFLKIKKRSKTRFRSPEMNSLLQQVKATKNVEELRSILSKTKARISRKRGPQASEEAAGLEIAQKILQDGIAHHVYDAGTLRRFAPPALPKKRGFLSTMYDHAADLAKDDAIGALIGVCVGGPGGAVAGAIDGSVGSVAENVYHYLMDSATPAY